MQIFVTVQGGRTRSLSFEDAHVSVSALKSQIADYEGIPSNEQRLVCAQRELSDDAVLSGDDLFFLSLSLRVVGGKGGFGSLLRGAGAKLGQKKTDNFDACRDLNGRRLRHANNEKKLAEWIAQEKERELEKVALQHIKKIANQHHFDDAKFTAEGQDIKESMSSALERGIDEAKKSGALVSKKRPLEEEAPKRRQAWTDDDDLFDAESEPETKEKKNKKAKEEHPEPITTTTTTTTTTSTTATASITPTNTTIEKSTTTTVTSTTTTIPATESINNNNSTSITSTSSSSPSSSLSSTPKIEYAPVDLSKYETAKELEEAIGGDGLKAELQRLGLLCGGTPADRAARLFLLKTTPLHKLDKKHFQKKKK